MPVVSADHHISMYLVGVRIRNLWDMLTRGRTSRAGAALGQSRRHDVDP